jgi:kynureninase
MHLDVRTPREAGARGGVVNVNVGAEAEKGCRALLDRNVCTDHRADGLRFSPHFFNTVDEVDHAFDELASVLAAL